MKQKLTEPKGEISKSTITVGDFNMLFCNYRKSQQKVRKDIKNWTTTIYHVDLTDSSMPSYPTTSEYTLFSSEHETLTKIAYIMGQKAFSINFKGLKSYTVCSLITNKLN